MQYQDLYPIYSKTNGNPCKSVKNACRKTYNHHEISKDEFVQTHRSRSEGSGKKSRNNDKLTFQNSSLAGNKISIRDNFEARRREVTHMKKDSNDGGQLIYTFRDKAENDEEIYDKIDHSFRSSHYNKNTLECPSKESTMNLSKMNVLHENEKFNTITRNNDSFSQTLLSMKNRNNELYHTKK